MGVYEVITFTHEQARGVYEVITFTRRRVRKLRIGVSSCWTPMGLPMGEPD